MHSCFQVRVTAMAPEAIAEWGWEHELQYVFSIALSFTKSYALLSWREIRGRAPFLLNKTYN
jgi:hypothetical protein